MTESQEVPLVVSPTEAPPELSGEPFNHYHHSLGYTIVIVTATFLPFSNSSLNLRHAYSKVQVTLPPGPIQVGLERVYRQLLVSNYFPFFLIVLPPRSVYRKQPILVHFGYAANLGIDWPEKYLTAC